MTSTTTEPHFLTAEEVAELFGRDKAGKLRVSARTIMRHKKNIPGLVTFGSKALWKRVPLMAWIEDVNSGKVLPFSRSA